MVDKTYAYPPFDQAKVVHPELIPGPQGDIGLTGADSTVPGPQGIQGDQGIQGIQGNVGAASVVPGPAGTDGTDGAAGSNGTDGFTVLNGTAAPTTEGVDGDFYIKTDTSEIYGPKAAGVWGSATPLIGADGTNGSSGTSATTGDIAPLTDDVDDLGTPTNRYKHLIMSGDIAMATGGNFGIYDGAVQRLNIQPTSIAILGGGNAIAVDATGIGTMGSFAPSLPFETDDIGSAGSKYKDIHLAGTVYAGVGTINTSDENLKDFSEVPTAVIDVLSKLTPRQYTWKKDPDGKAHFGFSAQEVETLFESHGLVAGDYFIVSNPGDSAEEFYGLAYTEFHALQLLYTQSLEKRIAALETLLIK